MFKKKKSINFYSSQVDDMWKKINAGVEVRVKNYLR